MLDTLHAYLAPLLIALPLAVVVLLITLRRDEPKEPPRRAPAAEPPAADPTLARSAGAGAGVGERSTLSAVAAATAAPPVPVPPAPATVLVVDDSAVVRAKLQRLLESAGFAVVLAHDGEEALARLEERRYAVLVTDLEMPRLDGFGLIAAVQGSLETENLPIVAITGHDEMHARVGDIAGLYGLFKKPWNDRELLRRIQTLAALGGGPIFEPVRGGAAQPSAPPQASHPSRPPAAGPV